MLPSLHGPLSLRLVAVWDRPKILRIRERGMLRVHLARRFEWWPTGLDVHRLQSDFVPQTFPDSVPDYAPGELEAIEAAEAKRARKLL